MAKLKSKKKGGNSGSSPRVIDYYTVYGLNRNSSCEEILVSLNSKLDQVLQMSQFAGEELRAKLAEQKRNLTQAIAKFRNKDNKKAYDEELDYAMENNLVDTEAAAIAEDVWEVIEKWYVERNYSAVIRKCNELLQTSAELRLYQYLSNSYFLTNKVDEALSTVAKCVEVHPKDITALKMAARAYNDFADNLDESQKYVNQMIEIDPDNAAVVNEQFFIYLCMNNKEMAFSLIDEYIEKNPSDNVFRRECANDIINYSYRLFKDMQTDSGLIRVIADSNDYATCLVLAEKAYNICSENFVKDHLDEVRFFGETEFNEDNRESLRWMKIGVITYGITAIAMLVMTIGGMGIGGFFAFLFAAALAGGLVYCTKGLTEVSNRPYWQLCKYYLTGKREPREEKYIMIGNILSGIIKFIWKASWGMMRFAFRLALPSGD